MKVLVGLSKRGFEDNEPYRMCIVETDEIKGGKQSSEWEDLDVSKLRLSSAFPVPIATQLAGSDIIVVFIPVLSSINFAIPLIWLPPPVTHMPFSLISSISSGGAFSIVDLTASTIFNASGNNTCNNSFDVISTSIGRPVLVFFPLTGSYF